ncbi:MAG: hypothetical protein JWQ07_81 [Ramlibacter sp.]|nr:hypothetical protein [Ramlibacter sp.]
MKRVFLSASVPLLDRGNFHESANPFLIQFAVRELLTVCLGRRLIVWGGHPAITPMVWAVCEDLGVEYSAAVKLYQSRFFEDAFPEENQRFRNVVYVGAVARDRERSLERMRRRMLTGPFSAGVFIGGMEGIFDEYELFRKLNPSARVIALRAPGGAALQLARRIKQKNDGIDFARMFYKKLSVAIDEQRDQVSRRRTSS